MDVSALSSVAISPSPISAGLKAISLVRNSLQNDNSFKEASITALANEPASQNEALKEVQNTKLEDAALQFEELFVSTLLKQMRETLEEGIFSGESSDSLGAIFDMFMGKHLAASKLLGIGQAVEAYTKQAGMTL